MGALGAVARAAAGGGSMSWLGPAGMVAGGLLGGVSSIFNNERNLSAQADAQNYAKWLNERTWEREDSAVQRRVADLRRAGLSPVLAAGSSAQTGSPIKIDPQVSQDPWGAEGAISGVTRAAQTQQSIMAAEAARTQALLNDANVIKAGAQASQAAVVAAQVSKEWGLGPDGKMILHPKFGNHYIKAAEYLAQKVQAIMNDKGAQGMVESIKRKYAETERRSKLTPAQQAKEDGKWHLFNYLDSLKGE